MGVGPGDPGLITRKAVGIISECGVIAIPESGGSRNIAREIAADLLDGKEILVCDMPMTRDNVALQQSHQIAANAIVKKLSEGSDVAFLTLGDPTVYSTYIYVHKLVAAMGY